MTAAKYRITGALALTLALPLAALGCSVDSATDSAESPAEDDSLGVAVSAVAEGVPALASEILRLTNVERQNQGLPALEYNVCLSLSARAHATNVARSGNASHDLYGRTPIARMHLTGYHGETAWAENMHNGWSSQDLGDSYPGQAVVWWMGSSGHRANILSPSFTHIGVAVAKIERDGAMHYYAVQNFAAGGTCRPSYVGLRRILRP